MIDVIYTVETGSYSDHAIHGFCLTLEEAARVAREAFKRHCDDCAYDADERRERVVDHDLWPRVYANPVNVLLGYGTVHEAKRMKWCEEDPVKP